MYWPRLHMPPGLGGAFWLAFLLVCLVELTLHNESVIHKYRAVFSNTTETIDVRSYVQILVWCSFLLTLLEPRIEQGLRAGLHRWGQLHFTYRGMAYAGLALAVIFFGGSSQKFIYFDF